MDRRNEIINLIKECSIPVSGSYIAKKLNVSRQVIVQDIALLRASGIEIVSTNKGYVINDSLSRVIKVKHSIDEIIDELTTIIDLGGKVVDCFVLHDSYGTISVDLNVNSRKDINDFINSKKSDLPLMNITNDIHYHTIKADSIELLDLIESELDKKGYLL